MNELVDTHTHLYAEEYEADRHEMIRRALSEGITKMYLPNIDRSSLLPMLNLCEAFPDNCFPMMGLHPCSVNASYKAELSFVESELAKGNYSGVGETGIDLYWDKTYLDEQRDSFRQHVKWAAELDLPLIIHTRNSFEEAFEIVAQAEKMPRGIFHCFSGTAEEAERILSLKTFKLGIGGVITYKNSTLPDVIRNIDIHHLVLETDSPYLPPVPFRGKRNESSYLKFVAARIAEIKNIPLAEVAEITTKNAGEIFVA
jgi:TatD DNase family protein